MLAVLCFMFPDALTTPSLRAAYDLPLMRKLLAAGMVFSAGFGLLTFLLNRQKRLGALGIVLTLVAMYLGGSSVQVGPRYDAPGYIGLDWFILDLLASAITFGACWRRSCRMKREPAHPATGILAGQPATSSSTIWRSASSCSSASSAVPSLFSWTINAGPAKLVQGAARRLVQFVVILLTADLMEYATHRAMHEVPALWRFHAVHHSVERIGLDGRVAAALPGADRHPHRGDPPRLRAGRERYPAAVLHHLGRDSRPGLVHSNFGLEVRAALKYIVATPLFHHWHHGSDKEAIDINYAAHTPLIDRLFGTYHMPTDRWPEHYGVVGDPLPKGMWRQFLYPFQRKTPPPPSV